MPALLIASTKPRVGKTAFAALLASRLLEQGKKVGLASAASDNSTDLEAFKTLVGDAAVADSPSNVEGDVSIVEGLSGDTAGNLRIAEELDARVVLIAELDDEVAGPAKEFGDRFVGVVINNLPRFRRHTLETELIPALESAGIPFLGAIPDDRRLVASTVRQISEHLDGAFSGWEEHSDELVDYVLIGGNILDWGVHYFSARENAIVIVRGDRPDIQMAALATPIKGMVLTEGVQPLEYVHYEADQEEVPVTVVAAGTHDATAALESLQETARFDHPGKLTRLVEIAADTVDFDAIDQALSQPVTG